MCGRFTIVMTMDELITRYDIDEIIQPFTKPNYNVAPTQMIPAIMNDGEKTKLDQLKWGLIPPWAKNEKIAYTTINARAETVAEKPAFRNAIKRKRCLIPASSFFEWQKIGRDKQPMRILLKNEDIFSMAGLYEFWRDPEGNIVNSCSIITTTPNELMADIHNRMPVILKKDDEALWLDPGTTDPEFVRHLLAPYPPEEMKAYPVSKAVGNVRNNGFELIKQLGASEINSL
ncbi:SOS response-associated peptidase [Paenibacillus sp. GP183]|uniref:SOS response-associated peptidase n=1 Tax=Paenibacillus sp. GP183 TaxID=1882751 RepID=UPI000895C813|nr:SOS response-associated peptidase [Paenibacillus sp. GP183]SED15197.1 Putative SOS response-associated peptidase YedK [Paenibacillus sp. GP183]